MISTSIGFLMMAIAVGGVLYFQWPKQPGDIHRLSPLATSTASAYVSPPLQANIEPVSETLSSNNTFEVRLSVTVPRIGSNPEAEITLTLSAEGVVQIVGHADWSIDRFEPGRAEDFTATVAVTGYGEGTLKLQAHTFDATGRKLWGKADDLFVLHTPDDFLLGKSSLFDLKREMLSRIPMSPAEYEKQMRNLLEGKELLFERQIRALQK